MLLSRSSGSRPMSRMCCSQAGRMSISRSSAPAGARRGARALSRVRAVVPKPGIVTARMPARGRPRRSNVRTQTSSASVESRPPDRPSTTRCDARRARAAARGRRSGSRRSRGSARRASRGPRARTGAARSSARRRCGCGAGIGRARTVPVGRAGRRARRRRSEVWRARSTRSRSTSTSVDDELAVAAEALALGEEDAVLGDQQVAAEDEVGRRLVDAGVGVDVGGERAARLLAHQLAAVLGLGHEVVRGRGVQEHGGARDRVARARRDRRPEVLADLDRERHRRAPPAAGTGGRCRRAPPGPRGAPRPRAPRAPRRTSAPRSTPCSRGGRSSARRPGAGPTGGRRPR